MKTATLPSLRVDPALREGAEAVLHEGETLSHFMEQAVRTSIQSRKARQEFITRGLTSRDEAKRTGKYFAASEVIDELEGMLAQAERKASR
jgi:predicted transcriptional regulator